MKLTMLNGDALDEWFARCRRRDGDSVHTTSIKGAAPKGATYSDGSPIERPVNVAWRDEITGDVFHIEYAQEPQP